MSNFDVFSNKFAQDIFLQKYSMNQQETWEQTSRRVTEAVCNQLLDSKTKEKIFKLILERRFIPGGRYLYSAGRPFHQVNNCFLFRAEDSREGWADLMYKTTSALMTGGGIGIDYSALREEGAIIKRTGGKSTGQIATMQMVNELGRHIMQGGQRRCLPKGTLVTMANGTKIAIENVPVGVYVTTRFGSRKVLASLNQGEQEVFKIITENGEALSTKNHRWLGADLARNKKWITTENLKVGGKLYNHPTSSELQYNNEDLKYYYMLGYYIGDGCAYSSGRTHEITFQFSNDWKDENQLNTITDVMRGLGTNPILRKGHGDCIELRCRSKTLVKEFQKTKAPKCEPILNEIFKLSSRAIATVLAGWLDADGYLNKDKWCISNKYENTAREIQLLFLKLGIKTTISRTNTCFEVRVNSHQRSAIHKYMGEFSVKINKTEFHQQTSEIPSDILEIKSFGKMQTYDLQIEEVEEFIANDFVSHNSAIYASLNWKHKDVDKFLKVKDHSPDLRAMKEKDFNFPLPMELTNVSINYDTEFFVAIENSEHPLHTRAIEIYTQNCKQAFSSAEPGMSFNYLKDNETLRNACCEVTSEDDSDKCNLGTLWINRFKDRREFSEGVKHAVLFLLCGGIYSDVPNDRIREIGLKNNRIGLGLGGIHEWLMVRGEKYHVSPELHKWLNVYEQESSAAAFIGAKQLSVAVPKGVRAIAPTGTIGIMAETTTGIEPLFCKAYKRRYFKEGKWLSQYVVDGAVKRLLDKGATLESIIDSYDISFKERVKFQADVQNYVDMAISSTCNMSPWGSEENNESTLDKNAKTLLKYAKRLRGFTCYPDGCRGGQPLTRVTLDEALREEGKVFEEQERECLNGVCGL